MELLGLRLRCRRRTGAAPWVPVGCCSALDEGSAVLRLCTMKTLLSMATRQLRVLPQRTVRLASTPLPAVTLPAASLPPGMDVRRLMRKPTAIPACSPLPQELRAEYLR